MSDLTKYTEAIKLEDDLSEPTLGSVIKDDTILMGTWASLAIGSFLYLQPFGLISLVALAYLGYRDVKATSKKQAKKESDRKESELAEAVIQQEEKLLEAQFKQLESTQPEQARAQQSEFVDNPWLKNRKPRYEGEVYASPEDKVSSQSDVSPEVKVEQARFRAPSVSELTKIPIHERAEKLLEDLALSGCDLRGLIHDPIVAVTGEQQSGKSTLLVILSVFESALLDKEIHYATTDSDIYPFRFTSVVDCPEGYKDEVEAVSKLVKGRASGHSWLFDELTKQSRETITQPLWNQLLTGFVKTRASARLVIHGKTLSAMGVPMGFNEQAKQEATILRAKRMSEAVGVAERRKLAHGGRYPSGKYVYLEMDSDKLADSQDCITLPDWLQFELNDEGSPCYVRSLLAYFPELQGMVQPKSYEPVPVKSVEVVSDGMDAVRKSLDNIWSVSAPHPAAEETSTDDSGIESNAQMFASSVVRYLEDKAVPKITLAQLLANCYELKKYLKLGSHDEAIRAKGRETARILTKKAAAMKLLKIDERGQSITIWPPESPLFGGVR
ncbi:hypothetical protein [Adonisia turfae]|uniref:Uncharacterized protein n=1 Tax=Adonisia turfae CCMR0081 TaxID=2292702 RepID=A0A6M0RSH4_9CYAN|nr:hypothetical protein [Adonisia turfae]NEZ58773.1 hypothetical protein [Adonisia turfae CCMR0081]